MKTIVISLGGSLIVPDKVNISLLEKFKKIIRKHKQKYRFVVVCGGGNIARIYIAALKKQNLSKKLQSMAGIAVTRLNARLMTYFFGKDANEGIPHDMKQVKNLLIKNKIVFCGALRYAEKETSDATSAKLASFFKCEFVNLTKVLGLYSKDPLKHRDAKFISRISWHNFNKISQKIKYKPGQHFVLDQHASQIIEKHKIRTYILGSNMKNFDNFLSGKKFKGTVIAS